MRSYLWKPDTCTPCDQLSQSYEDVLTYVLTKTRAHMLPKLSAALDRNTPETSQTSVNRRTDEESVCWHRGPVHGEKA